MSRWRSLIKVECLKLRRSPGLWVAVALPFLFALMDYRAMARGVGLRPMTPLELAILPYLPLKSLAVLWAGLFHPLLIAFVPPLLFRSEHRFSMWKHLQALPVPRHGTYLAKALVLLGINLLGLALVGVALWLEWELVALARPQVSFYFPWWAVFKVLGWMALGSLPLLGFYLWVADRISATAVPFMLGLVGLILTMALAGQEINPSWRRDLIPWVLPYTCTQRAIQFQEARQEAHFGATAFQKAEGPRPKKPVIDDSRLKIKIRIVTDLQYDELGLKRPDPTPTWLLISYSLSLSAALLGFGLWEARRDR